MAEVDELKRSQQRLTQAMLSSAESQRRLAERKAQAFNQTSTTSYSLGERYRELSTMQKCVFQVPGGTASSNERSIQAKRGHHGRRRISTHDSSGSQSPRTSNTRNSHSNLENSAPRPSRRESTSYVPSAISRTPERPSRASLRTDLSENEPSPSGRHHDRSSLGTDSIDHRRFESLAIEDPQGEVAPAAQIPAVGRRRRNHRDSIGAEQSYSAAFEEVKEEANEVHIHAPVVKADPAEEAKRKAEMTSLLLDACRRGSHREASHCLSLCANPWTKDPDTGDTCLHLSAKAGSKKCVKALLRCFESHRVRTEFVNATYGERRLAIFYCELHG
jgi:hypothetical protein